MKMIHYYCFRLRLCSSFKVVYLQELSVKRYRTLTSIFNYVLYLSRIIHNDKNKRHSVNYALVHLVKV